jgi:hypothetical protein
MALATLTALEIVLGVDNIIFISILTGKLPHRKQRRFDHRPGLAMTPFCSFPHLDHGTHKTLLTILNHEISSRDIILIVGGLFLWPRAP